MNTQIMNDLIKLIKAYSQAQTDASNTKYSLKTRAIAQTYAEAISARMIKLQKQL